MTNPLILLLILSSNYTEKIKMCCARVTLKEAVVQCYEFRDQGHLAPSSVYRVAAEASRYLELQGVILSKNYFIQYSPIFNSS